MPLNVYLQTVVIGNVPEITTSFFFFPKECISKLDLGIHESNRRSQNDKL